MASINSEPVAGKMEVTMAEDKLNSMVPAKRGRIGRPCKYNAALARKVCRMVEQGVPITHIVAAVGISFESLCDYRRKHPEFDRQIKEATSRGIAKRLDTIQRAMESQDERLAFQASVWYLTHVPGAAEHFSESRRIEVSGPDGSPLVGAIAVYLPRKEIEAAIIEVKPNEN
jgi:hypothetical protein